MTPRAAAAAALALGLLIALTANAAYAIPRGPVAVGLGLVAPLVLPVVLYLRTTFTADTRSHRLLRELATFAVAGPAAAVSYVHTFELVAGAGEPWILAVLAPLSSDGLAGMATLALHRLRVVPAVKPVRRPKSPTGVAAPPAPAGTPPAKSVGKPAGGKAIDWARSEWPCTAREIQLGTGVAKGSSHRIHKQVLAEREAS